ncbi:MAG: hypothetical protein ONB27_11840 [candidate division KSB1 bacterium]|nr:hypothetical protein [candidate division KSB1 bacterium]
MNRIMRWGVLVLWFAVVGGQGLLIGQTGEAISTAESSSQAGSLTPAIPTTEQQDSVKVFTLKDGSIVRGRIAQQDTAYITVITAAGIEMKIPRSEIISIKPLEGKMEQGEFVRSDPNYSRLLFAPTGRPLRKGHGYFSDFYVFFPGVAYGFTDNISLLAGMSIFPGVQPDNQVKFIAPRVGFWPSDRFAISAGTLFISLFEGAAAGIAFVTATVGPTDESFTMGFGLGYVKEEGKDFEFGRTPILTLGGNIRLSNSTALVSENWLVLNESAQFDEQPFALALRLFGDRLAGDIGFIFIGEVIRHGFPIPWLSLVYNFGRGR